MTSIYVNRPNLRFTVHQDSACGFVQAHRKKDQRRIDLSEENLPTFVASLTSGETRFSNSRILRDMWIFLNLATPERELRVATILLEAILARNPQMRGTALSVHDC